MFEICDVVNLAEIRELLLRPHPERVDVGDGVRPSVPSSSMTRAVPYGVGLADTEWLEDLNVIAEQGEIWKDVDIDRDGAGEIEKREARSP